MKKGFALLETIIVITFVTVSLLLLYGTFTSMIDNSRKNILYDDASNIYRMYYLKEYLELYDLQNYMDGVDIREITCEDFSTNSCSLLFDEYGLKDYQESNYSSTFNQYLHSLSNESDYSYRLVGEFIIEDEYHYASIGVMKE